MARATLTTETDSRTAVERQVSVAMNVLELITFPSLGPEFAGILAVYILPTMHSIDAIADRLPLGHVYWGFPI
ncbi:hypothetical protein RRF57_005055 [Xylaria bambusicola]|uniref:Uncharacterized protein n=1 Tax=Xylaria bambusicola TaxID=326684 RepID=A0AAN7UBG0_9PEZI